jgi:hypothetical protein
MRPTITVAFAAMLLTACASGTRGSSTEGTPRASTRRDADVITAEEIATTRTQTLYDAVRNLRPQWMIRRRPTAMVQRNEGELIVYVDGTRFGNLESLRQLNPGGVQAVRYFSPSSAGARFGPGHLLGAIEVTTRSQ